ncbi:MAG: hypothetical protein GY862_22750 [Gammaproteobacteria bacterium]|nr:hypothetical protein [Gammaproteobacteria bacterium]
MPDNNVDHQLKLETHAQIEFASDTLRVIYELVHRIKTERKKSWKSDDILKLLDTMLVEIATGVTAEDRLRASYIAAGKAAFSKGAARSDNPHKQNRTWQTWWDTGWRDAQCAQKNASEAATVQKIRVKPTEISRYYKVQLIKDSVVSEWDEVLHQYTSEGHGTKFPDHDDAMIMAEHLKPGAEGIVSVITVDKEMEPSANVTEEKRLKIC